MSEEILYTRYDASGSKKYVREILRIRPVSEVEGSLIRVLTKIVDVHPIVSGFEHGCRRVSLGLRKFESAVACAGNRREWTIIRPTYKRSRFSVNRAIQVLTLGLKA